MQGRLMRAGAIDACVLVAPYVPSYHGGVLFSFFFFFFFFLRFGMSKFFLGIFFYLKALAPFRLTSRDPLF